MQKEPVIHLEGATHEFQLYALNPDHPVPTITDDPKTWAFYRLTPANYGYQLKADDDLAAVERIAEVVRKIKARELSPDTDFREHWDAEVFPDGHPLVESMLPKGVKAAVIVGGQPQGHA